MSSCSEGLGWLRRRRGFSQHTFVDVQLLPVTWWGRGPGAVGSFPGCSTLRSLPLVYKYLFFKEVSTVPEVGAQDCCLLWREGSVSSPLCAPGIESSAPSGRAAHPAQQGGLLSGQQLNKPSGMEEEEVRTLALKSLGLGENPSQESELGGDQNTGPELRGGDLSAAEELEVGHWHLPVQ